MHVDQALSPIPQDETNHSKRRGAAALGFDYVGEIAVVAAVAFMDLLARAGKLAICPLPAPTGWYAIPLRLIVGFGFMQHGYAKLARGPEDFINILHAIGVPAAVMVGWVTIGVELIGGLLVVLGAFVPLATIPMAIILFVAIFTVHLPNGFSSIKLQFFDAAGAHFGQPGYETDLLYLSGLIALCFGGAGPLSVDGLLGSFRSTRSRR